MRLPARLPLGRLAGCTGRRALALAATAQPALATPLAASALPRALYAADVAAAHARPTAAAGAEPVDVSLSTAAGGGLTLQALMAAGVHLGHAPGRMHKAMLPFIYGER